MSRDETATDNEETKRIVVACVNRGLGVLGDTGRSATVYMLRAKYHVGEDGLANIDLLTNGLREVFGLGSAILLRAISDQLRVAAANGSSGSVLESEAKKVDEAIYGVEHGLA